MEHIEGILHRQQRPAARPAPDAPGEAPDDLLDQVERDLAAAIAPALEAGRRGIPPEPGLSAPFQFQSFDSAAEPPEDGMPLKSVEGVELDLSIELGRTEMLIEEVLQLSEGSVVPLDKLAGDPVDILVDGRLIARGEVLVLNDNFCVRVSEVLTPDF